MTVSQPPSGTDPTAQPPLHRVHRLPEPVDHTAHGKSPDTGDALTAEQQDHRHQVTTAALTRLEPATGRGRHPRRRRGVSALARSDQRTTGAAPCDTGGESAAPRSGSPPCRTARDPEGGDDGIPVRHTGQQRPQQHPRLERVEEAGADQPAFQQVAF